MVQRKNGANKMRHGSLFSGIGGFDLAAEWAGWTNVFHCEWNEFGKKVLNYYWPDAECFTDITKSNFKKYANTIDILTGGFPCQPYSSAGKRKGKEDERHLWPEMLRAIREIQPRWVVGENVLGLVNWSGGLVFHEVQADLEVEGYEVQPFLLPAAAVGAPHRRDRIWFVAYSIGRNERSGKYRSLRPENAKTNRKRTQTIYNAVGSDGNQGNVADTDSRGTQSKQNLRQEVSGKKWIDCNGSKRNASDTNLYGLSEHKEWKEIIYAGTRRNALSNIDGNGSEGIFNNATSIRQKYALQNGELEGRRFRQSYKRNFWDSFPSQSPICGGDDGLPTELDGITFPKWRTESIKGYGNAICPQVVYQIFKAINEYESTQL